MTSAAAWTRLRQASDREGSSDTELDGGRPGRSGLAGSFGAGRVGVGGQPQASLGRTPMGWTGSGRRQGSVLRDAMQRPRLSTWRLFLSSAADLPDKSPEKKRGPIAIGGRAPFASVDAVPRLRTCRPSHTEIPRILQQYLETDFATPPRPARKHYGHAFPFRDPPGSCYSGVRDMRGARS